MTTTWTLTANEIIIMALGELGVIAPGVEPDAEEEKDCLRRLNALLNSWQLRGVNLFRESSGTISVPGGSASGTLDSDIRSISSARLIVSATQERTLHPIDRTRYLQLPNKASVGKPTMYYFSRQASGVEMFLWPVSATDIEIKIDYQRGADTITNGDNPIDVPQDWQEAIYTNLAVRCAPMFGSAATLTPELVERARELERMVLDSDRPDSYYFEYEHSA